MAGLFWSKQFLDVNGDPLDGAKVYTYSPGTTTNKDVWIDSLKTTVDTNPSIADTLGRVWFYGDGLYRLKITDKNDITVWDFDDVRIKDITATTFTNTGLKINDTDASHTAAIKIGSDFTADRTITITPGDSDGDIAVLAVAQTWTADQTLTDNTKLTLGTGGDCDIYYDGTNVVIDPAVVGGGSVIFNGDLLFNDDAIRTITLSDAAGGNAVRLRFISKINTDTGSTPVIDFVSSKTDDSALTSRSTFVWTNGTTEQMEMLAGGALLINDSANANMTIGLTVNQGTNDDLIFCLKGGVVTGLTTIVLGNDVETDDFYTIEQHTNDTGGAHIQVLGESTLTETLIMDIWGGGRLQPQTRQLH